MGSRPSERKPRRGHVHWWVGGLTVLLLVGAGLAWRAQPRAPVSTAGGPTVTAQDRAQGVARRETRPTLDPARFVGKARAAHQVARDIPDVLDQLYCYCECDKLIGHKTLLSCYTDGHAAT